MTRFPRGSRESPAEGVRCDAPIIATDWGFMSGARSRQRGCSLSDFIGAKVMILSTVFGSVGATGRSPLHVIVTSSVADRALATHLSVQAISQSDFRGQTTSVSGYLRYTAECDSVILRCE